MKKCCQWWTKYVNYLEKLEKFAGQNSLGVYQELINETLTNYCPICGRKIKDNGVA